MSEVWERLNKETGKVVGRNINGNRIEQEPTNYKKYYTSQCGGGFSETDRVIGRRRRITVSKTKPQEVNDAERS